MGVASLVAAPLLEDPGRPARARVTFTGIEADDRRWSGALGAHETPADAAAHFEIDGDAPATAEGRQEALRAELCTDEHVRRHHRHRHSHKRNQHKRSRSLGDLVVRAPSVSWSDGGSGSTAGASTSVISTGRSGGAAAAAAAARAPLEAAFSGVIIAPDVTATELRVPSALAVQAAAPLAPQEVERINDQVSSDWPFPAARDPLVMMHRALMQDLDMLDEIVGRLCDKEAAGEQLCSWELAGLNEVLKTFDEVAGAHQAFEDDVLFPYLDKRVLLPAAATAQHSDLNAAMQRLRYVAHSVQRTQEDGVMVRVVHHAFEVLRERMLAHFEAEERLAVPLMRLHMTAREMLHELQHSMDHWGDGMTPHALECFVHMLRPLPSDAERLAYLERALGVSGSAATLVFMPAYHSAVGKHLHLMQQLLCGRQRLRRNSLTSLPALPTGLALSAVKGMGRMSRNAGGSVIAPAGGAGPSASAAEGSAAAASAATGHRSRQGSVVLSHQQISDACRGKSTLVRPGSPPQPADAALVAAMAAVPAMLPDGSAAGPGAQAAAAAEVAMEEGGAGPPAAASAAGAALAPAASTPRAEPQAAAGRQGAGHRVRRHKCVIM